MVEHTARLTLSILFRQLLPLTLLVGLSLVCSADASGAELAKDEATKKVLIFSSYEPVSPGSIIVSQNFSAILRKGSAVRIRVYHEFLDSSRISENKYEAIMVGLLRQKYEAEQLDLIFVLGVPALELLLRHEADLFLHTPKVFCFFEETEAFAQGLGPSVTGIRTKIEYSKTLEVALSLHPETEKVFVVAGSSGQDRFLLAEADKEFRKYQGRVEFIYLYGLTIGELQQKLATLPNNSIVMFLSFFLDSAGNSFSGPQGASLVASSSIAPVYSIAKTYLGSGIVGGSLLDFEAIGDQVGEIGLRILGGQRPGDIAPQTVPNVTMFDWRELRRWGISESRLPAGSIVEFKEPSFWEHYKWYIVAIIGVGCIEALLIAGLLINRARRRQSEEELRQSEERLQLAQRAARVGTWDWNLMTGESTWSEEIYNLLGLEPRDENASVEDFIEFIHPQDRERALSKLESVIRNGEVYYDEFRIIRCDSVILWLVSKGSVVRDDSGRAERMVGVNIDITERKQAEEAMRQIEQRNQDIIRALPDLMFVQTSDGDYVDYHANDTSNLLAPPEEFLGKNVRDVMPPELAEAFLSCFKRAKETGEPQIHEYMLPIHDEPRWYEARIIHTDADQFLSLVRDVTERKQAEESLKETLSQMSELKSQLEAENIYLQEEISLEHEFDEIIGNSEVIRKVLFQIKRVAHTNITVLILGETGTGKELAARAIHGASARKNKPLIKVNSAALPATLIESELFGHERGAFTSATARQLGRFELANGATIFLDEIGDLPLELQGKLLRVLEGGEFERLGSGKTIKVHVRIIAATNRDLQAEIKKGTFREDLWYRLNAFPIVMPPLRMRKEDIPLLVEAFARKFSKEQGKTIKGISPAMMKDLQDYSWPGNVRELANVIERAVINTKGDILRIADHLDRYQTIELPFTRQTLEDIERQYILKILEETDGRIEGPRGAARILGLNPSTLRTRMAKLGIRKSQGEPPLNPPEGQGEPSS